MSEFDVKKTKRYQNAVQGRDWQTCDLMFEEFEFLQKRIDELENLKEKLEQYEKGFKGACTTCENVGETNLKLKQENKQLKAFLREACKVMLMPHYTKKEFIKSDKIQEILKGGNDE